MTRFSILLLLVAAAVGGCSSDDRSADAYGNFEAVMTTVSAETSGMLMSFMVREGQHVSAGTRTAVIDTTQLALKRDVLRAQRMAAASRIDNVEAQLGVLEEKRQIAQREAARFESLAVRGAAPQKQVDDLRDQVRVLEREMASVRSQIGGIESEIRAVDAQIAQVADQIGRSVVVDPVGGTVITTFVEPHELAVAGRPLYTVADMDTLVLKAYVSGGQLPEIALGQRVDVVVDGPEGSLHTLSGTISWVASDAEFTPRFIQTREERVDLVYAVDVRVPNEDRLLKIGMPGEVHWSGEVE